MRFLAEQSILFLLLLLPGGLSDHLGQAIRPDLPFMLYGSDDVAKIQFSEAPCVFVAASPHSDLSGTTFAAGNLEGPLGSTVTVSQFVKKMVAGEGNQQGSAQFGAFCFPNGTSYLDVQFGNYSGLDRSSPEWHSTVFYFMSKEKVNGPCRGGGTQKIGGNVHILFPFMDGINPDISSECPAVFLAPSNIPEIRADELQSTLCAGVKFDVYACCLSAHVELFTVQNGVTRLDDPFIFSTKLFNRQRTAEYLRNAVALTTESQEWFETEIVVSYTQFDDPNRCIFEEIMVRKTDIGRIGSNPYGTQQMDVTLSTTDKVASAVEFSVSANREECMSLNVSFKIIGEPKFNHTNVLDLPPSFTLSNLESIRFTYRQLDGEGCAFPSYFSVHYKGIDTYTTTVAPTTTAIPTTTSATTTSSSSSTPLATSTINWDETTTTRPLTTTSGKDGGAPPSSTSTPPSTTAKKTTTEEITTTSPKTTTKDGKNGAISPQFVVCTTLSALLFSYLV